MGMVTTLWSLYGKKLFTWLSLVVSFMASFVLSFFPLDVLDGIWDLIESVSEGFLTYSSLTTSEQCFRMFFMSDEKRKEQDSNEASYTFRKDSLSRTVSLQTLANAPATPPPPHPLPTPMHLFVKIAT